MTVSSDTIAAIATAPGRGGVAVVRISGPDAFAVASRVCGRAAPFASADAGRFFRTRFTAPRTGLVLDDGLALVFAAPRSYTGEDVVELQGHGGAVAPRRVLEACCDAGARLARRGEYTLRAFLNGRLDLSAAEAVIDLVDARTGRAADDALARLGGAFAKPFERFYVAALDLAARLEHVLDFDEGELPDGFAERLFADVARLRHDVQRCLATAREGRLLREGARVVLAGAPNAGKSSLLNALLGEGRAIVSPVAGTTRDVIEEALEIDGWPVRLMDVAGLRETDDPIERDGVARAKDLIAKADVVLALDCAVDAPCVLPLHAKCDLDGIPRERPPASRAPLRVSAKTGEGLPELVREIAAALARLAAKADDAPGADVTTRQREFLASAETALGRVAAAPDLVVAAGACREAAEALGALLGKTCSEDLLDALFSRFCVGK